MGFSFVFHGSVPRDEILGALVGHTWWFGEDVWPRLHGGYRPFEPPRWWKALFDGRAVEQGEEQGNGTVAELRPAEGGMQQGIPVLEAQD